MADASGAAFPNLAPAPSSADEVRPPRAPRHPMLISAVTGAPGMAGQDVIIRNVSTRGMCIASSRFVPDPGTMLEVMLPGGLEVEAQVRWVGEGEFGVLLSQELDPENLASSSRQRRHGLAGIIDRMLEKRPSG